MLELLMEQRKTMREILDSTADKLGIKNVNEYELLSRFKDAFYRAVEKRFVVDEDGWISLGRTEDGSYEYAKLDENGNVFWKKVGLEADLNVDFGKLERALEVGSSPPEEEEGGGGGGGGKFSSPIPLNTYRFIALLLITASSVALLYSSTTALLRKDLAQAGIRFLASLLIASLGYVLLKTIPAQ